MNHLAKQSEKCNNSFTVSKALHITTYNPVWDGQLFHDPKEDQSAVVWWLTGTSSSSHSIKYLLQRSIGEQNFKLKEPMARYNQTPSVIIKTLMLFYGSWWKKRLVFFFIETTAQTVTSVTDSLVSETATMQQTSKKLHVRVYRQELSCFRDCQTL